MSKEWRLNVIKMLVISYLIYKANVIAVKLPVSYFLHIYNLILQCIWKDKTPRINNTIENEKKKVQDLYKVTITNAVWYWQKNRHINEMGTFIPCWWKCGLVQETQLQSLHWGYPLEKRMAICSNSLAWKIPWTEEPGGLQSMRSQKSWTQLSNWAHKYICVCVCVICVCVCVNIHILMT